MSELESLGDEPVSYRRPAAEQPNALGQFLLTAGAVWVGAMLAGICLFFLGRAWLGMQLAESAERFNKKNEEMRNRLDK